MIGSLNLTATARNPEARRETLRVRAGSAATVALNGVPAGSGVEIASVAVRVVNPAGQAIDVAAVRNAQRGAWAFDVPASHLAAPGTVEDGVLVYASGTGVSGERTWYVGAADLEVCPADGAVPSPGAAYCTLRLHEATPTAPARGDCRVSGGMLYVYDGAAWIEVGAAELAKKMDKLPAPCPANFFPVTKADGTLQRSAFSPGSFAQSWHEHYSYNIMHYTDPAMGAYNSLDYVLDDILARVSSLEASGGGALDGDVGVTLGTVYHDGMSAVAHPGKVGAGDYSDWPSPSDCMTCLMVRADRVLDPTSCGDFAMGGDLRSDYYSVVAGVEYEDSSCITARFALPLYDGATCYGNVQPTWDRTDFDYWREGTPSSGCIGRLVQDAEGTWWLCCTPRIKCFCESPMPATYGDDDPYAIATAIKSTYSLYYDTEVQMRSILQYASCGCDMGDVVADGYTTVAISGSPAI